MTARRARLAAALALLALAAPAAAAPWADRLDVPAAPSALAARRPLTGLARAGRRLVAVGERGHVLWSDDGGARWTQAAVPVSSDLTAVAFPTSRRGWAVGHDGVVLTSHDGGETWRRQLDGRRLGALLAAWGARAPEWARRQAELLRSRPGEPFLDVWFDDERKGVAVGAFGLVVATSDGGETWTPWLDRTGDVEGLHLYAVRRVGGRLWVAGERGLLLRLDPGEERFARVHPPVAGTFFALAACGPPGREVIVAAGLAGRAVFSADAGRTFGALATGGEEPIVGAAALPDGRLALLSAAGRLLVGAAAGGPLLEVGAAPGPGAALVADGPDAVVVAGGGGAARVRLAAPGASP